MMMMRSRYHSHFHDVKGVNDVVRILKSSRLTMRYVLGWLAGWLETV